MNKTFNLYCDESTHLQRDGMPYMLISYIGTPYNQLPQHKEFISNLKKKFNLKGEIKWSNVSSSQQIFFEELIDYFFSTDLYFRCIIIRKNQIDVENDDLFDEFYFKMYYQLLHHKLNMEYAYNVYLDIKDTRSSKKTKKLKDILTHNASIRNLQSIHSYESSLMQLTDLIMGAVNYKLRGLNKMIAKNKLIEKIEKQCNGRLDRGTPKNEEKMNRFFIDLDKS